MKNKIIYTLMLITLTINGCSTSNDNDLSSKKNLEFLNGTNWVADYSGVNSGGTVNYYRFTNNYASPFEEWYGSIDVSCYDYYQTSNDTFEITINTQNTLKIVFGVGTNTQTYLFTKDGDVLMLKLTLVYVNSNDGLTSVVDNLILNKTSVNVDGLLVCD